MGTCAFKLPQIRIAQAEIPVDAIGACDRVVATIVLRISFQRLLQQRDSPDVILALFQKYGYLVQGTRQKQAVVQFFGDALCPFRFH